MPTKPIYRNGKLIGYRWGESGKLYPISKFGKKKAKAKADKQARAIYASGYKGYSFFPGVGTRGVVLRRRRDGFRQRYHVILSRPKAIKELGGGEVIAEPKYDGTRTMAEIENNEVKLINRRDVDKTEIYPELKDIPKHVEGDAILDGEVVAITKDQPYGDFNLLSQRDRLKNKGLINLRSKKIPLTYIAFDILKKGEKDVKKQPLSERKQLLDSIIKNAPIIKKIEHSDDPEGLLKKVKAAHGEGIVVKKTNAPYQEGPNRVWEKLKIAKENDVAITGFTPGTGKRKGTFGALKMAVHTKSGFKPVGLVGTGFKEDDLSLIRKKLSSGNKLVARVAFRKTGSQGNYIEPRFIALRDDLLPRQTHF